jgi:hypothetical protein
MEEAMSKHAADKRKSSDGGRVKAFVAVERRVTEEGSHAAVQEVLRRPAERGEQNRRAQEFMRIERGIEA